jgi:hypothetical protein
LQQPRIVAEQRLPQRLESTGRQLGASPSRHTFRQASIVASPCGPWFGVVVFLVSFFIYYTLVHYIVKTISDNFLRKIINNHLFIN